MKLLFGFIFSSALTVLFEALSLMLTLSAFKSFEDNFLISCLTGFFGAGGAYFGAIFSTGTLLAFFLVALDYISMLYSS